MRGFRRLRGRVVDEAGQPVAGARVMLAPAGRVWSRATSTLVTDDPSQTTAADGGFVFDRLDAKTYAVSAATDDRYAWPELASAGEPREVILRLRLGSTLVVHVAGDATPTKSRCDRAPIAGATVAFADRSAVTDERGTATIPGLAPCSFGAGVVGADGWGSRQLLMPTLDEDPGGIVESFVTLERGARIAGVVVNPFGRRVASAVVSVYAEPWNLHGRHATRADASGAWKLDVPAGTYRATVHSPTYKPMADVALACDGHTPQRDVVMRVGFRSPRHALRALLGLRPHMARVAGVILDDTGAPAAGARFSVASSSRGIVADGRSDSRGRFEVDVEPGDYRVRAGWTDPHGDRGLGTRSVRADGPAVTFVLPSGATIRGRALLDGTPVPYFGLTLEPMMYANSPIGVRTADGRFALPHVLPGTYTLRLLGPGTGFLVRKLVVERGRDVDLGDLAMPRGQHITGHVRDRAGAAVAGARACVGFGTVRLQGDRSRLQRWFDGCYETVTDADGAYVLDNIARRYPEGRPLQLWATHIRAGASVVRDLPATDATIDLDLVGAGRIAGIVEGLRGGHAGVRAVRPDEPAFARRVSLANDGRFELDDVPAGDYLVELDVPAPEQVAPARVTVVANETATATLVMTSSSVQLRVTVPPGRGRDLVFEPVSPGAGFDGRVRGVMNMGTSEVCVFEFVRPGEYRLSLEGTTRSITIDGAQAEQTIDLV